MTHSFHPRKNTHNHPLRSTNDTTTMDQLRERLQTLRRQHIEQRTTRAPSPSGCATSAATGREGGTAPPHCCFYEPTRYDMQMIQLINCKEFKVLSLTTFNDIQRHVTTFNDMNDHEAAQAKAKSDEAAKAEEATATITAPYHCTITAPSPRRIIAPSLRDVYP